MAAAGCITDTSATVKGVRQHEQDVPASFVPARESRGLRATQRAEHRLNGRGYASAVKDTAPMLFEIIVAQRAPAAEAWANHSVIHVL